MKTQHFTVSLEKADVKGAWTIFVVPFDVQKTFKDTGHVKVIGTINGIPYRSIISPRGDGTHYMIVNKEIRNKAGIEAGNNVDVVMKHDTAPRTVEIPSYLEELFNKNKEAKKLFDERAYSHKKAFVHWINSAKKEKTKEKRANKTIDMLYNNEKLK